MKQTVTLIIVLLQLVFFTCTDSITTTAGKSGDLCNNGTVHCLDDKAECRNDACACEFPQTVGKGDFACYLPSEVFTEVKNDPRVRMFSGDRVGLPMTCRYLLTHVKQQLRFYEMTAGTCEIMIHAWNQKNKGKFYAAGLDVAVRIVFSGSKRKKLSATFRISGVGENGIYEFRHIASPKNFLPNGPGLKSKKGPMIIRKHGIVIENIIDEVNNLAMLEIERCGMTVTFRPFDKVLNKDQTQIPGISAAFDLDHGSEFLSHDRVLALAPLSKGGKRIQAILHPGLNEEQSLLWRALTVDVKQSHPAAARKQCADAKIYLGFCLNDTHREMAVRQCWFILTQPRFASCYDTTFNGIHLMGLYNICIKYFCTDYILYQRYGHRRRRCKALVGHLKKCEHVQDIPDLQSLLRREVC